jgi:hypothetical protein
MFKRTRISSCALLALGTALMFSTPVFAQTAEGSLYGTAAGGTAVTIVNAETGQSRQIKADPDGTFTFSKLPPGKYRVSAGGVMREVNVAIGSGTQVSLVATDAQRIEVTGARVRSSIDVSSVESNSVFTQEQIQALPVVRDVKAVALLAPGTVKGDGGLADGNAPPSFGGASIAENGFYINGFDVTNIRNFLSYAELPFDAISQTQVKTGGYGVEYGRSLGGVVSIVTKRGTNEWKGGGAVYWSPEKLRSDGKNVLSREPDEPDTYYVFREKDTEGFLSYNIYGGGPIIKDKLFVYGLVEGRNDTSNDFDQTISTKEKSDRPNGLLKVDWILTDKHQLEFTGITTKKTVKVTDYTNAVRNSTTNDGTGAASTIELGGSVLIGKYTGYLTDNLTVSALVGKVKDQQPETYGARADAVNCPVVLEVNLDEIGCWAPPFPSIGGPDPNGPPLDTDTRKAGRLDLEYALGSHTIRGGLDYQKFTSVSNGGSTFTGGVYHRYFVTPASGIINGVPGNTPGQEYVRSRIINSTSGAYEVENSAYYIEDSWKVNKNWLLYGGLRWESFNNKNGDGVSFVEANNLLAPRLGFALDLNGDAQTKIYGNAGRYYIPVASNTNIRATRGELFTTDFYNYSGRAPVTAAPLNTVKIGNTLFSGDGSIPDPRTIADTGLKPMSQDEFILGIQQALSKGWTVGAKGVYRKVNDGMDDFCGHYAWDNYAADNGFTNFDSGTTATCILMNPGRAATIALDLENNGTYTPTTVPASYFNLAKYERTYQALELTADRPFDGKWGLGGSYVWSQSKGTAEGYVSSTIDQDDAGITQDFDYGSFTDGSNGYLPNDRRHVIKLFGLYGITDDWRIGGSATIASGRPKSCIGFVPPTVPDYSDSQGGSGGYTSASSYYCLNDAGETVLTQRGAAGRTPWSYTIDMSVAYTPKLAQGKLTLQMDIFNLFNSQKVVESNEVRDYSRGTSGTPPGQISQNYDLPQRFQDPRAVRLTARYEF